MQRVKTDQFGFDEWEKFENGEAYHSALYYRIFGSGKKIETITTVVFKGDNDLYAYDILDSDENIFMTSNFIYENAEQTKTEARAQALRSLMRTVSEEESRFEILSAAHE